MATTTANGTRRTTPRLSFDPIFKAIGTRNITEVARLVHKDRAQVTRWINDGLTAGAADDIATALNQRAADLWPEWDGIPIGEKPTASQRAVTPTVRAATPTAPLVELVAEDPPPRAPAPDADRPGRRSHRLRSRHRTLVPGRGDAVKQISEVAHHQVGKARRDKPIAPRMAGRGREGLRQGEGGVR